MNSEAVEFVCEPDPRRGNTPVKTEGPAEGGPHRHFPGDPPLNLPHKLKFFPFEVSAFE